MSNKMDCYISGVSLSVVREISTFSEHVYKAFAIQLVIVKEMHSCRILSAMNYIPLATMFLISSVYSFNGLLSPGLILSLQCVAVAHDTVVCWTWQKGILNNNCSSWKEARSLRILQYCQKI